MFKKDKEIEQLFSNEEEQYLIVENSEEELQIIKDEIEAKESKEEKEVKAYQALPQDFEDSSEIGHLAIPAKISISTLLPYIAQLIIIIIFGTLFYSTTQNSISSLKDRVSTLETTSYVKTEAQLNEQLLKQRIDELEGQVKDLKDQNKSALSNNTYYQKRGNVYYGGN